VTLVPLTGTHTSWCALLQRPLSGLYGRCLGTVQDDSYCHYCHSFRNWKRDAASSRLIWAQQYEVRAWTATSTKAIAVHEVYGDTIHGEAQLWRGTGEVAETLGSKICD
jgi:hypothetical protein